MVAVIMNCLALSGHSTASAAEYFELSLPDLHLAPAERLIAISLSINPGRIASIRDIPAGWRFTLDNPEGDKVTIEGSMKVGAAALGEPDILRLSRNWLKIVRSDMACHAKSDPRACVAFALNADIVITGDFEHIRHLALATSDFALTPTRP
jgi:hypothetical protein